MQFRVHETAMRQPSAGHPPAIRRVDGCVAGARRKDTKLKPYAELREKCYPDLQNSLGAGGRGARALR